MTNNVLLRSYKMTHDTGFAPNPYGGLLSLATCKPGIRSCAEVGEWIAGFTSRALCGDKPGEEKLIYLMQVSEKLLFEEYYEKCPQKRPENCICGDNIYIKPSNGVYKQIANKYHNMCEFYDDTSTPFVLLATEFYYFGINAVLIPEKYRPNIPMGPAKYGIITENKQAQVFIDWVIEKAAGRHGLIGEPHNGSQSESCSNNVSSGYKNDFIR